MLARYVQLLLSHCWSICHFPYIGLEKAIMSGSLPSMLAYTHHITSHTHTQTLICMEIIYVYLYLEHKPIFLNLHLYIKKKFFLISYPSSLKGKTWKAGFIAAIFQKILISNSGWTRLGHKYLHQLFCFCTHSKEQQWCKQQRNLETFALVFSITLNFPINVWKFSRDWLWACIAIFIFINNNSRFYWAHLLQGAISLCKSSFHPHTIFEA